MPAYTRPYALDCQFGQSLNPATHTLPPKRGTTSQKMYLSKFDRPNRELAVLKIWRTSARRIPDISISRYGIKRDRPRNQNVSDQRKRTYNPAPQARPPAWQIPDLLAQTSPGNYSPLPLENRSG